MSLIAELRRRNVFKVAIAYAVVSWLIMQIASVIEGPLALPEWFDTIIIVLLALGFPIAMVFAWAFELTPDGIRSSTDVEVADSITHETSGKLNILIIGVLGVAVAFLLFDRFVLSSAESSTGDRLPDSIAVLPFENASPREEDAYFAFGLHEEILNQLTKIQDLNVIARTTMRQYAETQKPLTQIAEELNVETVMEGSVRYADGRIRVTAQLIDGRTGLHQWSETFERDIEDVFAIESNIAIIVANEMAVEFSNQERARIEAVPTKNSDAYQLYLRAKAGYNEQTLSGNEVCLDLIDRAVELDPQFVLAWVQKAWCHNFRQLVTPGDLAEQIAAARNALETARAIDPNEPRIYPALAYLALASFDWGGAAENYRRAAELGLRQEGDSLLDLAAGHLSKARGQIADTFRRDPFATTNSYFLFTVNEILGDSQAADAVFERGKALYAAWPAGNFGWSVVLLGRGDEASLAALAQLYPRDQVNPYVLTIGGSVLEDDALEAVRAAFAETPASNSLAHLVIAPAAAYHGDSQLALDSMRYASDGVATRLLNLWTPLFSEVRQLDSFKAYVRELGLVEFWRENGWPDLCEPVGGDDFTCE